MDITSRFAEVTRTDRAHRARWLLTSFYHDKLKAVADSSLGTIVCPTELDKESFSVAIARAGILPPPPSEPFPQTEQPVIEDVIDFLDFIRGYLQFEWRISETKAYELSLSEAIHLGFKTIAGAEKVVKPVMNKSENLLQAASYLYLANSKFSRHRKPAWRAVMASHRSHDLNSDLETLRTELDRIRSHVDLHVLFVSNDVPSVSQVPKYELKIEDLIETVYNGLKRRIPKENVRAIIVGAAGSPAEVFQQLRKC